MVIVISVFAAVPRLTPPNKSVRFPIPQVIYEFVSATACAVNTVVEGNTGLFHWGEKLSPRDVIIWPVEPRDPSVTVPSTYAPSNAIAPLLLIDNAPVFPL